jgi:hypothetical protein
MEQSMIKLELSLEEINVVLAALGRMPYESVAALIPKIQQQGQAQLQKEETTQE